MRAEEFFAGHPDALAVFDKVRAVLLGLGAVDVRPSRSQVAFRRRRGFASLWLPGRHLARPTAEVVLTIALGRRDPSPRFKQVAQPSPKHWMHHLEVRHPDEIDAQVVGWLQEAAERAD
jgi:hypothetical protein